MMNILNDNRALVLGSVAIGAAGLVASGYLLGDGLRRAKAAEREVTVRGVSERDVTANLATWTIQFSHTAADFASAQRSVDQQAKSVRAFLASAGIESADVADSDVSLSREAPSYNDNRPERFTVSRTVQVRTADVMRARRAYSSQADLLRGGVEMTSNSVSYSFTGLNVLKPEMIAEANRNARRSAEQFAKDSGADVGAMKSASQGYFSVGARDGDDCDDCGSGGGSTPFQKVRVVTTIVYDLG
ncbi:SIMPL domain-containing protein [Novosphingobium sp.]|uniref:SIMPL domain-containing protein n=1 Tax=Novosphingobium sp. TaxID=1874826 RepID=UPI0025FB9549|nr:SIMPL domain-containing protein [Novosphingobium sp.]